MALRQAKTAKGVIIWVDEKQEVGRCCFTNGDEHYVIELLDVWTDGRSTLIERKTGGFIVSVALLNCHELAKSVQAKLIDYQALVNAPERVEVAPSVFVDKEPIMSALKASVKAEYNKLGEQLKKL